MTQVPFSRTVGKAAPSLAVGILGCSDIAFRKFLPALEKCSGAHLVAVASRDREKGKRFLPGRLYQTLDYGELVVHPGVDLIYLSLPNHLHEEWSIRALERGKHVICEKPAGLSASSVARIIACARDRGVLFYENLMFLHHPQHARVRELVAAGAIGTPTALHSVFTFPFPPAGNFRLDAGLGGGAFHDLARYPLASALYFFAGESYGFSGVTQSRGSLTTELEGVALTSAGETLRFTIGFGRPYASFYEVTGELGRIRLERAYTTPADLENRILCSGREGDTTLIAPAADHFQLMIEEVARIITRGKPFGELHERTSKIALLGEQMKKGCSDYGKQ